MSPEDQRVWEEDAETEYAEAHAQARPATHSPADAEEDRAAAEAAEAKLAKVEALADEWESGAPSLEWNIPIGMTFASHLRAALADAPTEQRGDAGDCSNNEHVCSCGSGTEVHAADCNLWLNAPTEQTKGGE